jgi:hypothetical protein
MGSDFFPMTTYKIWISSGDDSFARTYFNELGAVQLTQEQVDKYFTFTEDGELEFDQDLLAEATEKEYDDPERDMPSWDTITDGCICWGPDVDDQNIGVSLADDEDNPIWVKSISTLPYYTQEEIEDGIPQENEEDDAIAYISYEMMSKEGVWIAYNSYERGGYIGELELPDDEEFDPSKLVVYLTEVAESWTVVSGIEYNGTDVYCDGDTIGKGIDWYVYHNDNLYSFK